jgi:hypothetical protein
MTDEMQEEDPVQNFANDTTTARRDEVPQVTGEVRVTPTSPAPSAVPNVHIPSTTGVHAWEAVRDYVVERSTELCGKFTRNTRQENTIFMGFADRWGDDAMAIARYAFETLNGEWMGAPVRPHRFAKNFDTIFAQKIAALL